VLEGLAHRFGQGGWASVVALDPEAKGLAVGEGEGQQQRVGCGSGAVLDGEAQALVGAADEVAGRVSPSVEVGAAA